MKRILFVCSANKDRSKTAEDHFSERFRSFEFDSAGTNRKLCQQLGTYYLTEEQLTLADIVYVMEKKHLETIQKKFGKTYNQKINILGIKDVYSYGSAELIEILKTKIPKFN